MSQKKYKNPCIRKCNYNDDKICVECFRSQQEIYFWGDMTDDEKAKVFENIKNRRKKYNNS